MKTHPSPRPFRQLLMISVLAGMLAGAGARGQQAANRQPAADAKSEENEEVVVLKEFSVRDTSGGSRPATETLGAMRTSTRLVESPITVSVLTPEFMQSFALTQEHQQASFVAGGNMVSEWQSGAAAVSLRGFGSNYYRNGFSRWGYNATVNVERIEYVKGPAAATFGRSSPGGLVNYITKRARRRPAAEFYVSFGGYGYNNFEGSYTGPLDKDLYFRADAGYNDRGGYQDWFYQRTHTLSTSFTKVLGPNTSLMFDVEYKLQSLNRGTPGLIPAWTNGTFVSPVTGQPVAGTVTGGRITRLAKFNARGPDDKTRRKITTFDSRFEHRFNRVLSLRVNGQVYFGTYDSWSYGLYIPSYRMSDATLHGRRPLHEDHETASFSGQADLLAVFNTGPVAHKLLLTMDGRHESGPQPDWEMPDEVYEALPDSVRNLSVERPDWSSFDHSLLTKKVRDDETITKDLGFLLSERAALLRGRVLLYASLRNDNFRADFENKLNPSQSGGLRRSVFNHTLGGVAHIIPGRFIFFANRSTSFTPSSTLDRGTGELQEPLTSKGIEAGFRGEIMPASATDGWRGLYWAASIYRIDRKAPQSNPYYSIDGGLEAGIPQYINSAVERVDGIELELFGTISRHTTVSVAYTRLHPYVKNYPDDRAREGMPLRYMPDTTLAATTRYRFTDGLLKGVLLGAAMRYTEEFFAYYGTAGSQVTGTDTIGGNLRLNYGPADRIEEIRPAVTLFDVFAEYQFKTGKYTHIVGINLNNALNATYYGHNGNPGNEREILIRWRLKF